MNRSQRSRRRTLRRLGSAAERRGGDSVLLSPTIPLNPDRKYVNKSTCGPGRAGCPALCIPRRRSILIETIHHSRGPTDPASLFLQPRRSMPMPCPAELADERSPPRRAIHLLPAPPPCRSRGRPRDSILPDFAEFRPVRFGLSARPRPIPLPPSFSLSLSLSLSHSPSASFLFHGGPLELCAAARIRSAFAESRRPGTPRAGHSGQRDMAFR